MRLFLLPCRWLRNASLWFRLLRILIRRYPRTWISKCRQHSLLRNWGKHATWLQGLIEMELMLSVSRTVASPFTWPEIACSFMSVTIATVFVPSNRVIICLRCNCATSQYNDPQNSCWVCNFMRQRPSACLGRTDEPCWYTAMLMNLYCPNHT